MLVLLAILLAAKLVIRYLYAKRQRAIAAAMRKRNASRDYYDDWYPVIRDDVIACITKEKTYPWGTDDLVKTYKCLVFWRSDRVYMCVERFVELSTNEYRCCAASSSRWLCRPESVFFVAMPRATCFFVCAMVRSSC